MASHLAELYGTEKDRVNCPFYFKMGACRHGDRCSRLHNKPQFSDSVLLQNMYINPAMTSIGPDGQPVAVDPREAQKHFEEFYEEVFEECEEKFGKVVEMYICDNLGDHMLGNVYIHFDEEDAATKCVGTLNGRFYAGRPIRAELTPVTDFKEARCWQYETGACHRGGYCNFMHIKQLSKALTRQLYGSSHALDRNKSGVGRRHPREEDRGPRPDDRPRNDRRDDRYRRKDDDYRRDDRSRDRDRGRGGRRDRYEDKDRDYRRDNDYRSRKRERDDERDRNDDRYRKRERSNSPKPERAPSPPAPLSVSDLPPPEASAPPAVPPAEVAPLPPQPDQE